MSHHEALLAYYRGDRVKTWRLSLSHPHSYDIIDMTTEENSNHQDPHFGAYTSSQQESQVP